MQVVVHDGSLDVFLDGRRKLEKRLQTVGVAFSHALTNKSDARFERLVDASRAAIVRRGGNVVDTAVDGAVDQNGAKNGVCRFAPPAQKQRQRFKVALRSDPENNVFGQTSLFLNQVLCDGPSL